MRKLALAVGLGLMLLSRTSMADDLQERQMEKNQNRRERQADAIEKMDNDNKKDAAEKARERNQDVRKRQKDVNEERRD